MAYAVSELYLSVTVIENRQSVLIPRKVVGPYINSMTLAMFLIKVYGILDTALI